MPGNVLSGGPAAGAAGAGTALCCGDPRIWRRVRRPAPRLAKDRSNPSARSNTAAAGPRGAPVSASGGPPDDQRAPLDRRSAPFGPTVGHPFGGPGLQTGPQWFPPPAPDLRPDAGRFLDDPTAPPADRRSAGAWLLTAVIGFAVGQIVGLVLLSLAAAVAGQYGELSRIASMSEPPEWYIGTSLVGLWVGFFGAPWVASRVRGTASLVADLGLRFRPVDVAGIGIGVGGQLLLDLAYAPFISHHIIRNFTGPTHKLFGASHGWGYLVVAVLTVCGAPVFEELFFRGLLFKALARLFAPAVPGPTARRAWAVVAAVALDGVLFGLAHWELYQFAGLAAFGAVLAWTSYRTNRLGMNIVAHASFNLWAVVATYLAGSGVILH